MAFVSKSRIRNPAKSSVPSYNEVDDLVNYDVLRDLLTVQSEHIIKRQNNKDRSGWQRGEKTVY